MACLRIINGAIFDTRCRIGIILKNCRYDCKLFYISKKKCIFALMRETIKIVALFVAMALTIAISVVPHCHHEGSIVLGIEHCDGSHHHSSADDSDCSQHSSIAEFQDVQNTQSPDIQAVLPLFICDVNPVLFSTCNYYSTHFYKLLEGLKFVSARRGPPCF